VLRLLENPAGDLQAVDCGKRKDELIEFGRKRGERARGEGKVREEGG
jgi:hypothetical protein